ncbi:MAG: DUF5329 family protein [Planctomycetes bacterium]|nr:DUF5329 family protein [Planctomycetota bacterium]
MRCFRRYGCYLLLGAALARGEGFAAETPPTREPRPVSAKTEVEKIAALLAAIAGADAKYTFIRNGEKHTGAEAAAHIRTKREKAKDKVKTAKQFIELCATQSEMTGTPYSVLNLADGKTVPLAEWLNGLLAEMEKLPAPPKAEAAAETPSVEELLKRLGADDFETREKSTEALIRLGAPALDAIAKYEKASADPEVQARCAKIRNAIGDPNRTAAHVLEALEKSNATFLRPGGHLLGSKFDGKNFAAHLRAKAMLQKFELTRPAREFVDEIAEKSSLHDSAYRVVFEDGKEQDLKAWLVETLKIPVAHEKKP